MIKYLLDSTVLGHFISRRHSVENRASQAREKGAVIGTGLPVVAEFLAGVEYSASRDANLPIVERKLRLLRFWPFDLEAAREYARLYAEMRRRGDRVQVIDLMIAAMARTIPSCVVVTSDGDFKRIPGLSVEDWTS